MDNCENEVRTYSGAKIAEYMKRKDKDYYKAKYRNLKNKHKLTQKCLDDAYKEIYDVRKTMRNLEYGYGQDRQAWKDELHHVREESEKKVRDAEYNYKHLSRETDILRHTGCIQTKYIKELEDLLKSNNIPFITKNGEYKDAMNELFKM